MKKTAKWIVGIASVATVSGTLGLIQMKANAPTEDSQAQALEGTTDPNPTSVQTQGTESLLPFDYAVGVKKDFPSVPYYISDETSIQGLTKAEIEEFFKQRESFLAALDWGEIPSVQGTNGSTITSGTPAIKSGVATQAPRMKSDRRTRGSRR